MTQNTRIGFISLGCPKALVDSEQILTRLKSEGYTTTAKYSEADLVVVNTCGFLDSARKESLEAIGEAMTKNGQVIVTGCLGAEAELIRQAHPDVIAITGPNQHENVVAAIHDVLPPKHDPFLDLVPAQGIKLTPRHYAYLKISEGCNHRCSFCIIPQLRGSLVSRPVSDVLSEAETLVNAGVQELLIISQDTSAYGVDTRYAPSQWKESEIPARLEDLCMALGELGVWVRLHYVYPYPHVDNLIPLIQEEKILPYLDVPFQHASQKILKSMKRPAAEAKTLDRIYNWRKQIPDLTIRSTFIVGFPGETEEDFDYLLEWLNEAQLDRIGCFKYEAVSGATANQLPGAVPEEIKTERWHELMALQKEISAKRLQEKVGQKIQVIVDEVNQDHIIGRSKGDAPEIDGNVFLPNTKFKIGDIVNAQVISSDSYDLWAE